jgi:hypothetical protein
MLWAILVAFVMLTAVLLLISGQKVLPGAVGAAYVPAKELFTPAERNFLAVLDQAAGPQFRVFGKVRVADIAMVKAGLGNSARQGALNRIAAKHFDFVVCRMDDLCVVCAVELNDKSHATSKARARDELLAKVCEAIRLPLIQIQARQTYSLSEVRAQLPESICARPQIQ